MTSPDPPRVPGVPLPPVELAARVGARHANDLDGFDEVGDAMRRAILGVLPDDWTFEGKRVLDFGCGAGRTLRHFVREAEIAEVHGCDIDAPSIDWLRSELSPPLHVFRCGEQPPLPLESSSFDLIWAISVFTHLDESWAEWLLELHRILDRGGLLLATFMGRGLSEAIAGEPWVEERIGMNVLFHGQPWEHGGPMVLHSPWWIREHWGRAFDILDLHDDGFIASGGFGGQGVVLMRKGESAADASELQRVNPAELREVEALRHNVCQLQRESLAAREALGRAQQSVAQLTDDA